MAEATHEDLTSFVARMGGEGALRVEESLGQGFVRLRISEAERRQARHDIRCSEDIVIELLRNARDASARQLFLATARESGRRTIVMLDDGDGVPRPLWEKVFEARVTSKLESVHMDRWGVHGRGMALYSIRENAEEARIMASVLGGGCAVRVVSDTSRLPERSDQSSWPQLGTDEDGNQIVERGPHNIIRTCCEFALEERGGCRLYLGSVPEIVATLRAQAPTPDAATLMASDLDELGVVERFAVAADARELREVACDCGLDISERTAHRIIAGQIRPVTSVMAHLRPHRTRRSRPVDLAADRRGLRLAPDDARAFAELMERDFAMIAERYYLTLTNPPKLRVSSDKIQVTFEISAED